MQSVVQRIVDTSYQLYIGTGQPTHLLLHRVGHELLQHIVHLYLRRAHESLTQATQEGSGTALRQHGKGVRLP